MEDNLLSTDSGDPGDIRILAKFTADTGEVAGNLYVPLNVTVEHLTLICKSLLQEVSSL